MEHEVHRTALNGQRGMVPQILVVCEKKECPRGNVRVLVDAGVLVAPGVLEVHTHLRCTSCGLPLRTVETAS